MHRTLQFLFKVFNRNRLSCQRTTLITTYLRLGINEFSYNILKLKLLQYSLSIGVEHALSQCEDGWKQQGENCYFVETGVSPSNKAMSWHVARGQCQWLKADLAIPRTKLEMDFLYNMVRNLSFICRLALDRLINSNQIIHLKAN